MVTSVGSLFTNDNISKVQDESNQSENTLRDDLHVYISVR